jgi:hypothetical protein
MWVAGCDECRRLWSTYAAYTTEHVRLGNKLQSATLKCDAEAIAFLRPQVELADEKRQSVREAIRGHDNQHGRGATAGQRPAGTDDHAAG